LFSAETHNLLTWVEIALAIVTFVAVTFVTAPYGRHDKGGWGPRIPARVGWIVMESPALLAFGAFYFAGPHRLEIAPLVMAGMWALHYTQRVILFPMRMRPDGKKMPLAIVGSAIAFNVLNASVNAPQLSAFGGYDSTWLRDPRFLLGALLFLAGFTINVRADNVLFALRKPGETGYRVPYGALHDLVANPNYLGEVIEWIGWAILTWSLAGASFALYTAANLVPRALSNRKWMRERLPDYPRERRAIIPYVL